MRSSPLSIQNPTIATGGAAIGIGPANYAHLRILLLSSMVYASHGSKASALIWPFKKNASMVTASDQWRVTGLGGDYGSEWIKYSDEDDPARQAYLDWLGGFFSGLSLADNINFFREHDFWYAVRRMDELCRAHPEDQVCHSAQKIAAELF